VFYPHCNSLSVICTDPAFNELYFLFKKSITTTVLTLKHSLTAIFHNHKDRNTKNGIVCPGNQTITTTTSMLPRSSNPETQMPLHQLIHHQNLQVIGDQIEVFHNPHLSNLDSAVPTQPHRYSCEFHGFDMPNAVKHL